MNFLSPWFLAGALLVAGPIIAHLIRRSTRDHTAFSATRFLQESQPRLQRRSRVQHPLLLLLRCLIVALLAAAFARPFFPDTPAQTVPTTPAEEVVIVLDESASMRRSGVWDEARQRVVQVARTLRSSDRLTVVAAAQNTRTVMTPDQWFSVMADGRVALLETLLKEQNPTWGPSFLDSGIDSALNAFFEAAVEAPRKRLVVVSDFASGARVSGLAGRDWPAGLEVTLERISVPLLNNAGIQWLGWTNASTPEARLRITRDRSGLTLPLRLQLKDAETLREVDEPQHIELAPGETRVVNIALPRPLTGPIQAELTGDSESFDNRAWIVPGIARETNILYLGAHDKDAPETALYYVSRALQNSPGRRVQVTALDPNQPALPESSFMIIAQPPSGDAVFTLRERLAQGTHVVMLLSSAETIGIAAALAGQSNWQADPANEGDALFGAIDFAHPLFSLFADPRYSDFTRIRFWRPTRFQIPENEATSVLARFDDGSPAVADIAVGKGRLLVWASDWTPRAGQWVLSSKFVPWLQGALERAEGGPPRPATAEIGNARQLVRAERAIWRAASKAEGDTTAALPSEPGAYQLAEDDRTRWVALQVPPEESRTDPMPLDVFEQLGVPLKPSESAGANPALAALDTGALETEGRQKVWRWLLLGTAGLLAFESLFALILGRRETPTPTT